MHPSRTLLSSSALVFGLFISVFAFAADTATNKSSTSPTKGLTEFAASKGVKTCLKRMEQVNNFVVGNNNRAGAYIFLPPNNANQSITSTSLEVYSASNVNAAPYYASTSVVPTSANDCGIVYDTVSYRAQNCDSVKKREFANYKFSGMVAKNIQIMTHDEKQPNSRTFLMPAGAGCIVINKETVFTQ